MAYQTNFKNNVEIVSNLKIDNYLYCDHIGNITSNGTYIDHFKIIGNIGSIPVISNSNNVTTLAIGNNNQVLTVDTSVNGLNLAWKTVSGGNSVSINYAIISETRSTGSLPTDTPVNNTWVQRTLNTINTSSANIALSNSIITLTAGTYIINGSAAAGTNSQEKTVNHKIRLYNITNSSIAIIGTSESITNAVSRTLINGIVTIASTTTFKLEHYASSSSGIFFGIPTSASGVSEVYSIIEILKVA